MFSIQPVDESALFPSELTADWWAGTHAEDLPNVTVQDQVWFFFGWEHLSSYWLRNPPDELDSLLQHLTLLNDQRLPSHPECALLAGKLVNNAIARINDIEALKPLAMLAVSNLETAAATTQGLETKDAVS